MWIQENSNLKKVTNWCNFYESKVKCSMNQTHLSIIYISQNIMLIQVLNKPKFLLYLTSIEQNLSNQINILFMKSNRKTHMHINKFAKTTIITYCKNNPILTSKRTYKSFQISLNINFDKYMFMWRSFTTSSIYRLIMPLAHKNILQHKRKNMRRNWARNLMLTCLDVYT